MRVKDLFKEGKRNIEKEWLRVILSFILVLAVSLITLFIIIIITSLVFTIDLSNLDQQAPLTIILHLIGSVLIFLISMIVIILFQTGYYYSILNIKDGGTFKMDDFYSVLGFNFNKTLLLVTKKVVYVFLYSLLFIVPGIIKAISYSQAVYILKDNPELSTGECLKESERLMSDKKAIYFKVILVPFIIYLLIEVLSIILHGGINEYYAQIQSDGYNKVYAITSLLSLIVTILLEPLLTSVYVTFYRKLVPFKGNIEDRI